MTNNERRRLILSLLAHTDTFRPCTSMHLKIATKNLIPMSLQQIHESFTNIELS